MPKLKIYKASAGSGKTFQLVREYLAIAIGDKEEFKHILGVTFTNKATAEMKKRIIDELVLLKNGNDSPHIQFLIEKFKCSPDDLREKSEDVLKSILHDYSSFHITTIDSFFQKLIKSFAKDIGLSAGYSLEMDTNYVLKKCIENLIQDLNVSSETFEWIKKSVMQKISDGKSWSFKEQLETLGKEVFKEKFQIVDSEMVSFYQHQNNFNEVYSMLNKIKSTYENEMERLAKKALSLIKSQNLDYIDFKWGTTSFANTFNKIVKGDYELKGRFKNAKDDVNSWYTKSSNNQDKIDSIIAVYHSGLNQIVNDIIEFDKAENKNYLTALSCLEFYFQFVLFSELQNYIRKYRDENDTMLISDTASFISGVMGNHEESFVFEKMGNYFNHFLIDEFQDTSLLQWRNFKPLLSNSISQDNVAVLLGDVKQSIYRFRNGDLRLLLYKAGEEISYHSEFFLDKNFRSAPEIVKFNNTLFEVSKVLLSEVYLNSFETNQVNNLITENSHYIIKAYENQSQLISDKKYNDKGYVEVNFIQSNSELDITQIILSRLKSNIDDILSRNYDPAEIVILVRNKKEAGLIFNYLTEAVQKNQTIKEYEIITENSLKLGSSPFVKLILSALYCVNDINDSLHKAQLKYNYYRYVLNSDLNFHQVFTSGNSGVEVNDSVSVFFDKIDLLQQMNLFDLSSELINIFQLSEQRDQVLFIKGFQDSILDFIKDYEVSLPAFIEWWETNASERTISTPENKNALNIMTIHKSKGLEFPVVIIPFCNWNFDHSSNNDNIIWTSIQNEPFNQLPVIPVKYSRELMNTWFSDDYANEKLASYLDNLNLLYVALTRSENELYIYTTYNSKEKNSVGDLMYKAINQKNNFDDEKYIVLNNFWNEDHQTLLIGEKIVKETNGHDLERFILHPISNRPFSSKLSIKRQYYALYKNDKIHTGNLIHEFLFRLDNLENTEILLNKFVDEGKVNVIQKNYLNDLLDEMKRSSMILSWFNSSAKVYKERVLSDSQGNIFIPDRVVVSQNVTSVIDFKTGDKNISHQNQVKNYMNILSSMGYQNIKGYIFYTLDMNIIELS